MLNPEIKQVAHELRQKLDIEQVAHELGQKLEIIKISKIRKCIDTFNRVIRTRVANVITLLIEIWGKFLRASPDLISAPHFWRTVNDL
jgi:hypothetical protein